MDRPWDGAVCTSPHLNSSCILLSNIGAGHDRYRRGRDDEYESTNAGVPFAQLDTRRLPCLSERAPFMSAVGYTVEKVHPYSFIEALHLEPSKVTIPPYSFEAVPFRWLSRETLGGELLDRVPAYRQDAEDLVDRVLGHASPRWVMHGDNQRAAIEAFFEPIERGRSLVFIYVKHSPLQDMSIRRLLVGAASVSDVQLPNDWNAAGAAPFPSSMWETAVSHTLRPDQRTGILLPYQKLAVLQAAGTDVSSALAWAPEGREIEFSYVTEHLSDDAAIEALASLEQAARSLPALGLSVPDTALSWLDQQREALWRFRGPTPGLASVLAFLAVEQPYAVARDLIATEPLDPWAPLETGLRDPSHLPEKVRARLTSTIRKVWNALSDAERNGLKILSSMDLSRTQVEALATHGTAVPLGLAQLAENPYWASICTFGQDEHVPFAAVDRACFPRPGAGYSSLAASIADLGDPQDRRRAEALVTDVLEVAGESGDTLLPQTEVLERAAGYALERPPQLNELTLRALGLDSASLREPKDWSPIYGAELANSVPALKLGRYWELAEVIRDWVERLRGRARFPSLANPRALVDAALVGTVMDEAEERARTEKAAGLAELYASPLSVLIGPAGTGKTTLLKALTEQVRGDGPVYLLTPTGKARVQLAKRVGPAATIASFLTPTGRFDRNRYRVIGAHNRVDAGLVVIDEASMLTEEMLAAALDAFRNIKRLVFVGDPRQLPPIGAGRPFVDLVNELRPDSFTAPLRVGPGYVELRVPRRQVGSVDNGSTKAGVRADLELAAWFGSEDLDVDADQIWAALESEPDQQTVRYIPWAGEAIGDVLRRTLEEELDLQPIDGVRYGSGVEAAFALSYGATINDGYVNWDLGAGERSEAWQILSPTRTQAHGVTQINRFIKHTFRATDTERAQRTSRGVNIPKPLGAEMLVCGDKVMATTNDPRRRSFPKGSGLDYVANGEIGVAFGKQGSGPKNSLPLLIEYSSQPRATYSYAASKVDDPPLELAWAITVHKAQGSEFETTFLVLPANGAPSRELLYTALTRQRDRVVILHEGILDDLRELSQPWQSETSRRLTDLFRSSKAISIPIPGAAPDSGRRVDGLVMHVTKDGQVVKSKNEVIIADILGDVAAGRWTYELPFTGADGRKTLPDFTIERADGTFVYWEHAGMLDVPDYARKWGLKQQWYTDNGVLTYPEVGPAGCLLVTDDRKGVDVPAWTALARDAIGPVTQRRPRGPGSPGVRTR